LEFLEKAKIRLDHWIHHSAHHQEEYEMLADQLEEAGRKESAGHLKEMIELTARSIECLKKAIAALD
jgi:hypothetical protein